MKLPEWDSAAAWVLILASLMLWCVSCKSTDMRKGPEIIATQYVEELYHAYNEAYARLEAVGAPVRHYNGQIRVSFKVCSYPAKLGYADKKNGRYAVTIGKVTEMCLDPSGGFQHKVAMGELGHYILMKREEEDYYWLRKACLLPE